MALNPRLLSDIEYICDEVKTMWEKLQLAHGYEFPYIPTWLSFPTSANVGSLYMNNEWILSKLQEYVEEIYTHDVIVAAIDRNEMTESIEQRFSYGWDYRAKDARYFIATNYAMPILKTPGGIYDQSTWINDVDTLITALKDLWDDYENDDSPVMAAPKDYPCISWPGEYPWNGHWCGKLYDEYVIKNNMVSDVDSTEIIGWYIYSDILYEYRAISGGALFRALEDTSPYGEWGPDSDNNDFKRRKWSRDNEEDDWELDEDWTFCFEKLEHNDGSWDLNYAIKYVGNLPTGNYNKQTKGDWDFIVEDSY